MNMDAWIDYQAKEKLSSDTKYDVKLKGIEITINETRRSNSDSLGKQGTRD